MINLGNQQQAQNEWARVRRQAFVQLIYDGLAQQSSALVPFQDLRVRLPLQGSRIETAQETLGYARSYNHHLCFLYR